MALGASNCFTEAKRGCGDSAYIPCSTKEQSAECTNLCSGCSEVGRGGSGKSGGAGKCLATCKCLRRRRNNAVCGSRGESESARSNRNCVPCPRESASCHDASAWSVVESVPVGRACRKWDAISSSKTRHTSTCGVGESGCCI